MIPRNSRGSDKGVTVQIPEGVLRVGENLIRMRTGACQYDIDVMRLNDLTLVQR